MTTEELYGLNYPVKSLAIANPFVEKVLYKSSYILGQQMRPFCMFANDVQKQYNVTDMATFGGLLDTNVSLIDEIADFRQGLYKNIGVYLDKTNDVHKKFLFYDYLLTVAICYVEVPRFITKNGYAQQSYDKFFATRNPELMATWMGREASEMQVKYSAQIQLNQSSVVEKELRCVKLVKNSKGNKITVPKKAMPIEKMKCIPLFMLDALVKGVQPHLYSNIVEFTFIKDNGTVRIVPATLSESILMDYYHDNNLVAQLLAGADLDKVQQGAITMSSTMARCFFKVPEVGLSRYDVTGTRSIDVARLLNIRIVNEVSRYFIDADIDSVVDNFKELIEQKMIRHQEDLPLIYKDMTGEEPLPNMTTTDFITALYNDVDKKNTIQSTTYRQSLHIYMITHPQYFPNYTGIRVQNTTPTMSRPSDMSSVGFDNEEITNFG